MKDYAVILSEASPKVKFVPNKQRPVESYLWYNFQFDIQPHTFVDYYREKLGITNESVALFGIDSWNHEFHHEELPVESFSKIIKIRGAKFGIIPTDDPAKTIVMMNAPFERPQQLSVGAGSGGYPWQYLDSQRPPTDSELKEYFNLSEYQRDRFREQW